MIDGAGTNHFVTLMIFMNYLLEIIIRHLTNHSNILHTNIIIKYHFVTLMIFMSYSCILKIGMSHSKVHISPGGRRVLPYML